MLHSADDHSAKSIRTVLLLRPFWEPDYTLRQLTKVARLVHPSGKLMAIRNGRENPSGWRRKLGIELIDAADDVWQENAIGLIRAADAVIAHFAPRNRSGLAFMAPIRPDPTPHSGDTDLLRERVHESGGSRGVLLELEYCRRAKAEAKLVVLVPEPFMNRVIDVLHAVELQQPGTFFRDTESGLEALTPRVSAIDEALSVLNQARAIITYRRFGDRAFCARLKGELSGLITPSVPHVLTSGPEIVTGIPSEPAPLPPDGGLKHIRFTPVQNLIKIPAGNIVELSLAEVVSVHSSLAGQRIKCPRCSGGSKAMFWYQYSLEPDLTEGAGVFMRCQHCGHDDYL